MNAGGIVVVIAGVWLGCQVFGGDMLTRLGIVSTGKGDPIVYPGTAKPTATTGGSSSGTLNA